MKATWRLRVERLSLCLRCDRSESISIHTTSSSVRIAIEQRISGSHFKIIFCDS
jgi:hypothetical protein